jgi:hypothetical protein
MLVVSGANLPISFAKKLSQPQSIRPTTEGAKVMESRRTVRKESAAKDSKSVEELTFKSLEIKWSMDYDILNLHEKVLEYLKTIIEKKKSLETTINSFSNFNKHEIKPAEVITIRNKILAMREELKKLDQISASDYISETCSILNEYKSLCNAGPRVFGQKEEINIVTFTRKAELVESYFDIAKFYCPMNVIRDIKLNGTCFYCNGALIDEGDNTVCSNCNSISVKMETSIKYSEGEDQFINKESAKKDINFREIVMQWQGTYPVNIPQRVYDEIQEYASKFKNLDLSKISKLDLYKIMQELGLGQWYKHLSKIHIELTKKHPTDISKYEENVIKRGEYINQIYSEIKDVDRSNFLHGLHLIWLFLMNEGCVPDMNDFVLVKDRKIEYSNLEVLERGFKILRKTHPEMQWKIFQMP